MMKLTAMRPVFYAGKEHAAGEVFDCSERDARILVAVGRAKKHEPQDEKEEEENKPGTYKRRDMRAKK